MDCIFFIVRFKYIAYSCGHRGRGRQVVVDNNGIYNGSKIYIDIKVF